MAGVELEFSLDVMAGRLSASRVAMQSYDLPRFVSGSTLNFRITLVKANPAGGFGAFSIIPLDGLSMMVGIGDAGASLTSGALAVDQGALVGSVPLNVVAITGLLFPIQKIIEFRVSDGGLYQPCQMPCTLINSILAVATVPAVPPEEALGKNEAAQAYVPRDGGAPGQGYFMKSASGILFSVVVNDDGELHAERVV